VGDPHLERTGFAGSQPESGGPPGQNGSEQRFRQLFAESIEGLALLEAVYGEEREPVDFRFVEVNPAFARLTGSKVERLIGRSASDVRSLGRAWVERLAIVAISGEPRQYEEHNETLDRHLGVRVFRPAPGQVAALVSDVTDRVRAEAELSDRTAFAETIVASAGEGLIVYDRNLRYVVWNPVMEELTGLPASVALGKRAQHLFPEIMAQGVRENLERALAGTPSSREFEFTVPQTGRSGWVLGTYGPHRNSAGDIIGVVASVRDITARHQAEEALRRSEEQFRTIFDNVGDGVAIYEPEGRLIEVNRALCERLGYSREEMLTMTIGSVIVPEMAVLLPERIAKVMQGGVWSFDTAYVRRDGTSIPIEAVVRQIEFRGRPAILSVQRDISERKRAEEAAREQARFLQQLVDAIPIPINAKDVVGRYTLCNAAFAARAGIDPARVVGKTAAELGITEADLHRTRDQTTLRDGTIQSYEADMQRADGTAVRELFTKAPIRAEDGTVTGTVSAALDITARHQAEQALRASEEQFRTIFDSIGDAVAIVGLDGRFLQVNRLACESLGYSHDEMLAMSLPDIDAPDTAVRIPANIERIMGEGSAVFETTQVRRDGSRIPVEVAARKIDFRGQPAILAVHRDITERKRAEETIRRSEERFRALFEHAADAIFIGDSDGRLIEANRAAAESLGYSHDELVNMRVADLNTPEAAALVPERMAALAEQRSLAFETTHMRKDGSPMAVELSVAVIDVAGSQAFLGIARDLSERKRAEAERTLLEEELRQAQKMESIGRLAGGIAHDFNNLLTAIRGYADLALEELPTDAPARADLEQILQASDRAVGLTRQLLAFARRTVLQPELIELGAVVRSVEPLLKRLLGEDVTLATVTPPTRGRVLADPHQMEQAIVNLAVNARDAMPDGGTLTIKTADVDLDEEFVRQHKGATVGPNAMLAVTDTGTGMNEATMAHLFEPFFTTKGPGKGTGLGLATVWGTIRQSGGTILTRSETGKGSTFTIYLPLSQKTPKMAARETLAGHAAGPGMRRGTILVVEDDDGVRAFVGRILASAGYRVLSAPDGPTALKTPSDQPVDLLLTDVVMPVMGGREVAERLTASRPGLRVLYVSGHAENAIVRQGVLDPDIRYLAKPFTAEALLGAVDTALTVGADRAGRRARRRR
jgi:two-component system cell cycle sensor histidine kinase/response regulator CckA